MKTTYTHCASLAAAAILLCPPVAAIHTSANGHTDSICQIPYIQANATLQQTNDTLNDLAELPLPAVPAEMREPQARADFIMAHFWDTLSFTDKQRCRNTAFMEQNLVNFMSLMPHASARGRDTAVSRLLTRAAADTASLSLIAATAETYLYAPDSPMRDEELYIGFLSAMTSADNIPAEMCLRPAAQLEAAMKNRCGTMAADFSFTDADGITRTLHGVTASAHHDTPADSLMLIFYDPLCHSCNSLISRLSNDSAVSSAVAAGHLIVLTIYMGDDITAWRAAQPSLPHDWLAGHTDDLIGSGLYPLLRLPAIYLLDSKKTVIRKEY